MAAVIEVTDLCKNYGSFPAVKKISFTVERGEVFALLGANGAGKTTTMDVLSGFLRPTTGRVRVLDEDPAEARPVAKGQVGVMLQEAGFFEDLTVTQTVDAWRRFYDDPMPRAEALDVTGLTERAHTSVGKLSGGERRRLDLALSLLGRPKVLFLDEPTTGLDPEARHNTWALLRRLTAEGLTVLLTTHYMEEAEYLAQRVAICDHGEIVREGRTDAISASSGASVSFRPHPQIPAGDLPVSAEATVETDGDRIKIRTGEPQQLLAALLAWAPAHGVELNDLQVDSGSLEQAFLDARRQDEE